MMLYSKCWWTVVLLTVLFLSASPAAVYGQVDVPIPGVNPVSATPEAASETVESDADGWMQTISDMPGQDWVRLALSTLAVLLVAYAIGKSINEIALRIVKRTDSSLDDALLEAVRPLIPWFLVALGFQLATYRIGLSTDIGTQTLQHLYFLLYLLVAFVAVWRLIHFFSIWYEAGLPKNEAGSARPLIPLMQRTAQLGLILITLAILLDHFDIRFVAVATALGLGGLAVSFAAKDTLSDIISGVIIIIDQPFRLGDRIEIQDANTRGDVVSIGLRSTHIRTPDNRTVIVPNSIIGNNLIINHTYPDLRIRVQSEVGLPYGVDILEGCEIIEQAVRKDEAVINDQPVDVLFRSFGDSALTIRVRWWIESYVDRQQSLDRINVAIYNALNDARIQIPFPQRDVHHKIRSDDMTYISSMMGGGESTLKGTSESAPDIESPN